LPTIVGDLHGLNHLSWVVTAYLLTSTTVALLYGKISDLYGRKPVYQVAIVLFLIGSALAGLSQNMTQLIIFRGVQGLGAGGLIVLAQTIIGDIVSPRERGRYQGYFGAVFGLALLGVALLVLFLVREHFAAEPILPLSLFRNAVFSTAGGAAFIIGVAMFGAIVFLPIYFQLVRGADPTNSGLQLLPLVVGLFGTSIAAGQIIRRT